MLNFDELLGNRVKGILKLADFLLPMKGHAFAAAWTAWMVTMHTGLLRTPLLGRAPLCDQDASCKATSRIHSVLLDASMLVLSSCRLRDILMAFASLSAASWNCSSSWLSFSWTGCDLLWPLSLRDMKQLPPATRKDTQLAHHPCPGSRVALTYQSITETAPD